MNTTVASQIVLHTARLLLRPPIESDLDAWAKCMADERAMMYVGGVQSRASAWKSLAIAVGSWCLRGYGQFSIVERATGQWIGRTGPAHPEGWPWPEVGWIIDPNRWKNGFAKEAAEAALAWTFGSLGWYEVYHLIDSQNSASIALALALGATNRGTTFLPPPRESEQLDVWHSTATDWASRSGHLVPEGEVC